MIRIVIADDHKIVLDGLISLIEPHENIEIVGEALDGNGVMSILQIKEVDVVVLDINMPEMNGVETTKLIREHYPSLKILILTMYNEIGFIRKIAEAGAHGYILKNKGKEELIYAIESVYNGEPYFGKEVTKTMISSMKGSDVVGEIKLTKREIDVLKLIADGKKTREIAEILVIAETTVNTHRQNLLAKTGASNSAALSRFAFKHGYIS